MNIVDFAELQSHYTGAINKRKWIVNNKDLLFKYFEECEFKPAILSKKLNTSYATIKRLLSSVNLWELALIKKQNYKSGRKRTTSIDKFGYRYADSSFDYKNDRGEIVRRLEHHVIAEQKLGRKLKDNELVHHVDLDKLNNHPDNLYVCENNNEHRRLHCLLESIAGEAVRCGLIKFHPEHGYYLDNKVGYVAN